MEVNQSVSQELVLRQLIDVRPPYFALRSLVLNKPGHARARIVPEQPLGYEAPPLSAAEAGRHLAILGACACSSVRRPVGMHYYLARSATLVGHAVAPEASVTELFAHAQAVGATEGREANARAELVAAASCSPIFTLDVSYQVLAKPVFERLFAKHHRDLRAQPRRDRLQEPEMRALRRNPYTQPLEIAVTERSRERARGELLVLEHICSGHFPFYPALPVAMMMQGLASMCAQVAAARCGTEARLRIARAEIAAERLVFAGERLVLEARFDSSRPGDRYRALAALSDGTVMGHADVQMVVT